MTTDTTTTTATDTNDYQQEEWVNHPYGVALGLLAFAVFFLATFIGSMLVTGGYGSSSLYFIAWSLFAFGIALICGSVPAWTIITLTDKFTGHRNDQNGG